MKRVAVVSILAIMLGILVATPAMAQLVDGEDPRDPNLVYLEIRPDLDEHRMVKKAFIPAPFDIAPGVFTGYLLKRLALDPDEELYLSICIPERWDGVHNPLIHITSAISSTENATAGYILNLQWNQVTPNVVEVVPVAFASVSAMRFALNAPQYSCYRDWFVIDYSINATDPIIADDVMAFRLSRGDIAPWAPKADELAGDLIILEISALFPRGDLLGDPGNVVTEEEMEEIGIQFGIFNIILEGWTAFFLIFFGLIFILGLSLLAFWQYNPLLFMLVAGASMIFGLYWFDAFTTNLGLALGLMMIVYALVCVGFAFRCIFKREIPSEE